MCPIKWSWFEAYIYPNIFPLPSRSPCQFAIQSRSTTLKFYNPASNPQSNSVRYPKHHQSRFQQPELLEARSTALRRPALLVSIGPCFSTMMYFQLFVQQAEWANAVLNMEYCLAQSFTHTQTRSNIKHQSSFLLYSWLEILRTLPRLSNITTPQILKPRQDPAPGWQARSYSYQYRAQEAFVFVPTFA